MKTYIITGATGRNGKLIAKQLLENGQKVKAMSRKLENLAELVSLGAEPVVGNANDKDFVEKAFSGADVAFCLISPDLKSNNVRAEQEIQADNFLNAVQKNNIKHVMLLSSVGAHARNGAGIVDGLGYMEDIFSQLTDANVMYLRPAYFMENTLWQIDLIKQMGITGSPIGPDVKLPMVATKDIAEVAAQNLLELNFNGHVIKYVLGPRDYSYNEVTSLIASGIAKSDLKYVQFPYPDAIGGMVAGGMVSEDVARQMVALGQGINEGVVTHTHPRNQENTTPTTYEEFASTFSWVYQNS